MRHRSVDPTVYPPVVTQHALERYQIHHPEAVYADVVNAWKYAHDTSPELAQQLLGRRRLDAGRTYKVAPDFRGMFVTGANERTRELRMITYLRFQLTQERLCRGWFGSTEPANEEPVPVVLDAPAMFNPPMMRASTHVINWLGLRAYDVLASGELSEQPRRVVIHEIHHAEILDRQIGTHASTWILLTDLGLLRVDYEHGAPKAAICYADEEP